MMSVYSQTTEPPETRLIVTWAPLIVAAVDGVHSIPARSQPAGTASLTV